MHGLQQWILRSFKFQDIFITQTAAWALFSVTLLYTVEMLYAYFPVCHTEILTRLCSEARFNAVPLTESVGVKNPTGIILGHHWLDSAPRWGSRCCTHHCFSTCQHGEKGTKTALASPRPTLGEPLVQSMDFGARLPASVDMTPSTISYKLRAQPWAINLTPKPDKRTISQEHRSKKWAECLSLAFVSLSVLFLCAYL